MLNKKIVYLSFELKNVIKMNIEIKIHKNNMIYNFLF